MAEGLCPRDWLSLGTLRRASRHLLQSRRRRRQPRMMAALAMEADRCLQGKGLSQGTARSERLLHKKHHPLRMEAQVMEEGRCQLAASSLDMGRKTAAMMAAQCPLLLQQCQR